MRQARPRDRLERRLDRDGASAASAPPRATRACSTRSRASEFHLFGAHREDALRGVPGEIIAQRHGAICRATVDGAVWITHLKRPGHFKLPADARARARRLELDVPELPAPLHARPTRRRSARSPTRSTRGVGYLHFDFYNGAMSTDQCRRLLEAYRYARVARHARDRADGRRATSSPTAST